MSYLLDPWPYFRPFFSCFQIHRAKVHSANTILKSWAARDLPLACLIFYNTKSSQFVARQSSLLIHLSTLDLRDRATGQWTNKCSWPLCPCRHGKQVGLASSPHWMSLSIVNNLCCKQSHIVRQAPVKGKRKYMKKEKVEEEKIYSVLVYMIHFSF